MGIIIIVRNNWLYGIIKYGILNHRKDHLLYFKMEDKTDINIGSLQQIIVISAIQYNNQIFRKNNWSKP